MRFPPLPPVVKNLLIINVVIWLAMAMIPSLNDSLTRILGLHFFTSPGFNAAQIFTYMFLHGGLTHLFFNMFALVMFGGIIERTMGSRRFLSYYITCGIVAALVQMAVYAIMISRYSAMVSPQDFEYIVERGWNLIRQGYNFTDTTAGIINSLVNGPMVGASGAIYGIILAFGMLFPNAPIYIWFIPIPVKAKYLVIGYGALELLNGLGGIVDNVAHFAHLGGMLGGIIMILYWKKKGYFNNNWMF